MNPLWSNAIWIVHIYVSADATPTSLTMGNPLKKNFKKKNNKKWQNLFVSFLLLLLFILVETGLHKMWGNSVHEVAEEGILLVIFLFL